MKTFLMLALVMTGCGPPCTLDGSCPDAPTEHTADYTPPVPDAGIRYLLPDGGSALIDAGAP